MIKIGILGDIGSGKSFIARQFGYPVFNADKEVSKIYKNNKSFFLRLNKKLPKYIKSYPIKKKDLIEAIKHNKTNLNIIIKIVHPIIRKKINFFFRKNKKSKIVILDVPLLIENNLNNNSFILIFVESKKSEINKRLKKRLNFNRSLINNFKKIQKPLKFKKKISHYTIKNNFRLLTAKKSVKLVIKKILYERNHT